MFDFLSLQASPSHAFSSTKAAARGTINHVQNAAGVNRWRALHCRLFRNIDTTTASCRHHLKQNRPRPLSSNPLKSGWPKRRWRSCATILVNSRSRSGPARRPRRRSSAGQQEGRRRGRGRTARAPLRPPQLQNRHRLAKPAAQPRRTHPPSTRTLGRYSVLSCKSIDVMFFCRHCQRFE